MRNHTNISTINSTNLTCDIDADIVKDVAKKSRFRNTNRIRICQMRILNRKYQYFETLMFVLLFLWFSIQFVLRFFELYALLVFELLISILVVLVKKMFSLKSFQSEIKSWNAIVSWIILRRYHWELKACIRAVSFFDIDTISDNAQDFVENSWHYWIVWFLNQSMTDSNWKNRYLEKNWKNRNSKTMKISRTSQKSKKNVDLLSNWMWFLIFCKWNRCDFVMFSRQRDDLNTEFLSKYWNWFEIWIRNVIDFITNAENVNQFARHSDVIFEDFQELRMIQILIWDWQYWRFCRKIDWFSDSNIDVIIELRKDSRFAKNLIRILKVFRNK